MWLKKSMNSCRKLGAHPIFGEQLRFIACGWLRFLDRFTWILRALRKPVTLRGSSLNKIRGTLGLGDSEEFVHDASQGMWASISAVHHVFQRTNVMLYAARVEFEARA